MSEVDFIAIAGPPRVGKTKLANALNKAQPRPMAPFEMFYGQKRCQPDLTADERWDFWRKARAYQPYLEAHVDQAVRTQPGSIIEADVFTPELMANLRGEYAVRAVFLGLSYTTLDTIKANEGPFNWVTREDAPAYLIDRLAELTMERSAQIQAECEVFGERFIDLHPDYETAHHQALAHLLG